MSYKGNWRDVVLFVCTVLFAMVWWDVPHSRSNWLPMFVFLILLSVVVFFYTRAAPSTRCAACEGRTQRGRCAPKKSVMAAQCFSAAASS